MAFLLLHLAVTLTLFAMSAPILWTAVRKRGLPRFVWLGADVCGAGKPLLFYVSVVMAVAIGVCAARLGVLFFEHYLLGHLYGR